MARNLIQPIRITTPRISAIRFTPPKRERVPAKKLNELKEKSKGKCMRCKTSLRGFTPHVHHMNMKATDNKMTNLKLVCPTCHAKYHKEKTKIVTGRTLMGDRTYKVVKRKTKTRKVRVGTDLLGNPKYKTIKGTSKRKKVKIKAKKKKISRNPWKIDF